MSSPGSPDDTDIIESRLRMLGEYDCSSFESVPHCTIVETGQATGSLADPTTPKRRRHTDDDSYPPTVSNLSDQYRSKLSSADHDLEDDSIAHTHSAATERSREDVRSASHALSNAVESETVDSSSTPCKARVFSGTHTRNSVDDGIQYDVDRHTSKTLSVEKFLQLAFDLDDDEFQKLYDRVKGYTTENHSKYEKHRNDFLQAAGKVKREKGNKGATKANHRESKLEKKMYQPFAELGNMFLEAAENDQDKHGDIEVRLHVMNEKTLDGTKGTRKPDIVLIPKKDQVRLATGGSGESSKKTDGAKAGLDSKGKKAESDKRGLDDDGGDAKKDKKADTKGKVDVKQILSVFEFKTGGTSKREREEDLSSVDAASTCSGSSKRSRSSREASSKPKGMPVSKKAGQRRPSPTRKRSAGNSRTQPTSSGAVPEKYEPGDGHRATVMHTSAALKTQGFLEGSTEQGTDSDSTGSRQLASYATEMLSARGDRVHAFGVRVNADEVTFALYHRSGIIEANNFALDNHAVYLGMFLLMFQKDPTFYGYNAIMGYCDPFNLNGLNTKMDTSVLQVEKGVEGEINDFSGLEIGELISAEYCLIGRGSAVYRARLRENEGLVVKFSWQPKDRTPEVKFIRDAREAIGKNVPIVYGHAEVPLEDDSRFAKLRDACGEKGKHTEKEFRILVMKYYHGLSQVKDFDELWDLAVQCAICEYSLRLT